MKPFFKPEDFLNFDGRLGAEPICNQIASMANVKLEREGKVVYGQIKDHQILGNLCNFDTEKIESDNYQALLINIESIEKCKHPKDKIQQATFFDVETKTRYPVWYCQCGITLEPDTFKVVND